jgi:2,4-dienoyl-CoA reductase-like NADH-dependent reductase (Old Yellow Enzyme family)
MSHLFSPLNIRGVTLRNRIVMSPMCTYSAESEGLATDWHLVHLGSRAVGGAGLVLTETVAIDPAGRIHERELGLWSDAQMEPLARIVRFCQAQGAAVGIQLAHAGRKAWIATQGQGPDAILGPSPLPHAPGWETPKEMTEADIGGIVDFFENAARRAAEIGFNVVEIHAAHGYLLHQFLSPLSNHREDQYGGSLENRARLHLAVAQAVRQVWPPDRPLFMRVSASDWSEGGLRPADLASVARMLKGNGVDLIDCSSGGLTAERPPDSGPGYQVPFAEQIRREGKIRTAAVGLITSPELADEIIRNERADLVALARELLRSPYWPLHAARVLGHDVDWPIQYERAKLSPRKRAVNRPFVLQKTE